MSDRVYNNEYQEYLASIDLSELVGNQEILQMLMSQNDENPILLLTK
jgi:hypothetical protein